MTDHDGSLPDVRAADTLRDAYGASLPSHLQARIDQSVHTHMAAPAAPTRRPRLPLPRRMAAQIAAAGLVAALVAGGVLSQLHGSGVTPVSAQTVYDRAVVAAPAAGEAQHLTYRLTTSDGYTGTAELWVGTSTSDGADLRALTETLTRNGVPAPDLDVQFVSTGAAPRIYDPATNTIIVGKSDIMAMSGLRLLVGSYLAPKMATLLHLGNPGELTHGRKVTHSTLNGKGVYGLTLGDFGTLYFNDQTYVLEGLDWSDQSRSWQARLGDEKTLPLASVPAGTFELHAPATARTVQAPEGPKAGNDSSADVFDVMSALAAACHTTPVAMKGALGSNPSLTALQLCQQTRPGVTADQLYTDLSAQLKATLDAAVVNGTLTRSEADADYASLQQKLRRFVTAQLSGPSESAKP
jgi:hypothetical protein